MSQPRSTIRFVCSNCISPLEAKRRQAGARIRCPWCQTILIVPQESRPDVKAEVYAVTDPAEKSEVPPAERVVSFKCSLCGTRMDAGADQAGQKVACPDCGTSAVVPAPVQPAAAAPSPSAAPALADIYNVLEGQGQPPPTVQEVYRRHIPVVCLRCHTRLHATEDQVGQVLVCPDCGTGNVVPPAEAIDAPAPLDDVEGYQLAAIGEKPAPKALGGRQEFTFTCPLCQTRLQAAREQAGQPMVCPDCNRPFRIPPAPEEQPHWDPFQDGIEVYDLAAPIQARPAAADRPAPAPQPVLPQSPSETRTPREKAERHAPTPPSETRRPQEEAAPGPSQSLSEGRRPGKDAESLVSRRPKLPPRPLVNGVFAFPFYRESRLAWIKFTAGTVLAWGIAVLTWPVAALVAGVTLLMSLAYIAWASKCFLTILTQTANGVDRIEEWSSEDFVESLFQSLFIVNSVILSAVIGWCVEALVAGLPLPHGAVAAVLLFLTFPVILLSMLETGSVLNPISLAVWGSLGSRWWVWCGFYALAGSLLAALVGLDFALAALASPWAALPWPILAALAMMIYFRLLGRLGWCITSRSRRRAKRSED